MMKTFSILAVLLSAGLMVSCAGTRKATTTSPKAVAATAASPASIIGKSIRLTTTDGTDISTIAKGNDNAYEGLEDIAYITYDKTGADTAKLEVEHMGTMHSKESYRLKFTDATHAIITGGASGEYGTLSPMPVSGTFTLSR